MVRSLMFGCVLSLSGAHVQAQELSSAELVEQMQAGGVVVYMRHAQTERDYADQVTADPQNCATQRVLSEAGWRQAREIGRAFGRLDIPVSSVTSSQFCRAWQSADLAFGVYKKDAALNFEKAEVYTEAQVQKMRENVVPMLSQVVPAGEVPVIVGHDDPFEAATGIYPEPQGVVYVLKPDGVGGFVVLGSISPEAWGDLG